MQPVREWVVHQLQRTSGPVLAGRRGAVTARQLLDRGRIAVLLDGLDEMPEFLRSDAVPVPPRDGG